MDEVVVAVVVGAADELVVLGGAPNSGFVAGAEVDVVVSGVVVVVEDFAPPKRADVDVVAEEASVAAVLAPNRLAVDVAGADASEVAGFAPNTLDGTVEEVEASVVVGLLPPNRFEVGAEAAGLVPPKTDVVAGAVDVGVVEVGAELAGVAPKTVLPIAVVDGAALVAVLPKLKADFWAGADVVVDGALASEVVGFAPPNMLPLAVESAGLALPKALEFPVELPLPPNKLLAAGAVFAPSAGFAPKSPPDWFCVPPNRLEPALVALSDGGGPAGVVELPKLKVAGFAGVVVVPPALPNKLAPVGLVALPNKDWGSVVGVDDPLPCFCA